MSILLITHDLGVVAEIAHEVAVMYAGRIVERAGVHELFAAPLHPYTRGLFRSLPKLGDTRERLDTIPGAVPNPMGLPPGCAFHPRCDLSASLAGEQTNVVCDGEGCMVNKRCVDETPVLREIRPGHWCACFGCGENES